MLMPSGRQCAIQKWMSCVSRVDAASPASRVQVDVPRRGKCKWMSRVQSGCPASKRPASKVGVPRPSVQVSDPKWVSRVQASRYPASKRPGKWVSGCPASKRRARVQAPRLPRPKRRVSRVQAPRLPRPSAAFYISGALHPAWPHSPASVATLLRYGTWQTPEEHVPLPAVDVQASPSFRAGPA